tara:strand:- start:473 stop:898 length:426 start_codon:yes stop_codon:yes gene_type:complete
MVGTFTFTLREDEGQEKEWESKRDDQSVGETKKSSAGTAGSEKSFAVKESEVTQEGQGAKEREEAVKEQEEEIRSSKRDDDEKRSRHGTHSDQEAKREEKGKGKVEKNRKGRKEHASPEVLDDEEVESLLSKLEERQVMYL